MAAAVPRRDRRHQPKCQVALLRVLQEREFERVGGTKTLKSMPGHLRDNRDLEALIARAASGPTSTTGSRA